MFAPPVGGRRRGWRIGPVLWAGETERRSLPIRRFLLATLLAAALTAGPAVAQPRPCSQFNPVACIVAAATLYHQPVAEAELVAWRESRYEPSVRNGNCLGLYQILYPSTWRGITVAGRFLPNPYAKRSPWSARYSALTAMWMWAHGQQRQWSTYP